MKLLIILMLTMVSMTTDFERGYEDGWEEGYCYQIENCIAPYAPYAPLPNMQEDDDSYSDGYNRGFVDGRNEQNN